jgi:hypothetical protein
MAGLLLIDGVSGFVTGPMLPGRAGKAGCARLTLRKPGNQHARVALSPLSMMAFDSSNKGGSEESVGQSPSVGKSDDPPAIDELRYCVGKVNTIESEAGWQAMQDIADKAGAILLAEFRASFCRKVYTLCSVDVCFFTHFRWCLQFLVAWFGKMTRPRNSRHILVALSLV